MKARELAHRLDPLLRSISRELSERCSTLLALEAILDGPRSPRVVPRQRAVLRAEMETQREALGRLQDEIEHLGCSILGLDPLTVCIPEYGLLELEGLIWQPQPLG